MNSQRRSTRQHQTSQKYSSKRYYTAVRVILLFWIVASIIGLIVQAVMLNKKVSEKEMDRQIKYLNDKGTKIGMLIGNVIRIITLIFVYLFITHQI